MHFEYYCQMQMLKCIFFAFGNNSDLRQKSSQLLTYKLEVFVFGCKIVEHAFLVGRDFWLLQTGFY
jgi:hypothetical protein